MKKKPSLTISLWLLALTSVPLFAHAQLEQAAKENEAAKAACQKELPKLWQEIEQIEKDAVTIVFDKDLKNPGRTRGNNIDLNANLILKKNPQFPEDRLIIVLLHEYGHVLYGRKMKSAPTSNLARSPFERASENEFQAFKYSVEQAIERAKKGDKGPLNQVVKNLKIRAAQCKTDDPHCPAIKRLVEEPLWNEANRALSN